MLTLHELLYPRSMFDGLAARFGFVRTPSIPLTSVPAELPPSSIGVSRLPAPVSVPARVDAQIDDVVPVEQHHGFMLDENNEYHELDAFDPAMLVDPVEVNVTIVQSPQAHDGTGGLCRAAVPVAASFSADRTLPPPPVNDPATGDYAARPVDEVDVAFEQSPYIDYCSRSIYTVY